MARVATSTFAARLNEIWDLAREGLVTVDTQMNEGWLWSDPDRPYWSEEPPDESWPRRMKEGPMRGYSEMLGEFTYEGVRQPTLSMGPAGVWHASISRTCNPHCFTVYINVEAKSPLAALNKLKRAVMNKEWK